MRAAPRPWPRARRPAFRGRDSYAVGLGRGGKRPAGRRNKRTRANEVKETLAERAFGPAARAAGARASSDPALPHAVGCRGLRRHITKRPGQARPCARFPAGGHLATRSCDSLVPISLNTEMSWFAEVSLKYLSAPDAQFFNSVPFPSSTRIV